MNIISPAASPPGGAPRQHICRKTSHPLEGFLALQVAPHLDHEGIQALRQTSRAVRTLLDTYEHSTSQESLARSSELYPLPPTRCVLSSAAPQRHVVSHPSYALLEELETRKRKIDFLVDHSSYLAHGYKRSSLTSASATEDQRVKTGLKRAIWVCTHLADLEIQELGGPVGAIAPLPPHTEVEDGRGAQSDVDSEASSDSDTSTDILESILLTPRQARALTATQTPPPPQGTATSPESRSDSLRKSQLNFLSALSTTDLASLLVLAHLSTRGFEAYLGHRRLADYPQNIIAEWCVSVAENTLRHGVFFLFPQAQRGCPASGASASPTLLQTRYPNKAPARRDQSSEGGSEGRDTVVKGGGRRRNQGKAGGGRSKRGRAGALPQRSSFDDGRNHRMSEQRRQQVPSSSPACGTCCGKMAAHAAAMVCDVVEEMHRWEMGEEDVLPGLGMTLRGEFRRREGCEAGESVERAVQILMGRRKTAHEESEA